MAHHFEGHKLHHLCEEGLHTVHQIEHHGHEGHDAEKKKLIAILGHLKHVDTEEMIVDRLIDRVRLRLKPVLKKKLKEDVHFKRVATETQRLVSKDIHIPAGNEKLDEKLLAKIKEHLEELVRLSNEEIHMEHLLEHLRHAIDHIAREHSIE